MKTTARVCLALVCLGAPAGSVRPQTAATPEAIRTPAPSSLDERLTRVKERRASLERDVARLRGQEQSLLRELERLELEVRLRGEELKEVQLVLARTNAQLDRTTKRLAELNASLARARPLVVARVRALYKLGRLSYLRLLLSIDNPAAVFQGYRYVTTLARRDNERITAFRRDLTALAATREELTARTREALALRAETERKRRALDADRRRKEAFLNEMVAHKEVQAAFLAELEQAEDRLRLMLGGLAAAETALPLVALKGSLPWPVAGAVRVPFGRRKHPKFDTYTPQNGIEIAAPLETPVVAVHQGTVVFADYFLGYGLLVIVDHGGHHMTLYGHLGEAAVTVGARVNAGQTLGTVGAGLESAGLYFEVRSQGRPDDPMDWLRKAPL
jgi:septal ring factor EnvC (AmiA/AmiB activator)